MSSANASGADTKPNGSAKSREHNQGNQGRKFTVEQKAAVIRIRKCDHTAFYEILDVERTVSDGEIKKAYRKLSLLTHPDKNGYDGSDEAFKMVSRAFQILSDPEKKERYDRYGGDPDNRFSASASQSSPFSGFARQAGAGRGPMFEEEISPEELFQRFFAGAAMGGGFGPFGDAFGGQQFVFNIGGGPGIRVHQFGGGRPRRRPREANQEDERPQSLAGIITNLLPLLILFFFPLLSSFFSSTDTSNAGPQVRYAAEPPYTSQRSTPRYNFEYFVNPDDVAEYTTSKLQKLDLKIEQNFISTLQYQCQAEMQTRNRLMNEAQGWFFQDAERVRQARDMELANCKKLQSLGISPNFT